MENDTPILALDNVFLAAIQQWNDDLMDTVWNVYIINNSNFTLDSVMVVSKAFGTINGEMKKTGLLRHAFAKIPPTSAIKIERIDTSVLLLTNEFMVTYFIDNKLHDKKYIFPKGTITQMVVQEVPVLLVNGVIVK